jgi:hypothetical protein
VVYSVVKEKNRGEHIIEPDNDRQLIAGFIVDGDEDQCELIASTVVEEVADAAAPASNSTRALALVSAPCLVRMYWSSDLGGGGSTTSSLMANHPEAR